MNTLFKLAALPLFVLAIGNAAVAQTTFYVNVVIGLDGYDGLSPTPNPPANGPKQTISNAILASSPGDNIIVDYGNGILYPETVIADKKLTFGVSSYNGTGAPLIYGLNVNIAAGPPNNTATFTGEWRFQLGIAVLSGTVTLTGNVTAGLFSVSGPNGRLDLGHGLTHQVNGHVTITGGTLDGGSSNVGVTRDFVVAGGTFAPSTGTVILNGSADETIGASPLLFHNLTLSKPAGTVVLNAPVAVNGTLNLGTNKISTGPSTLSIVSGGTVASTTGYVIGNLQKSISSTGSVQFEIGDGSYSTPVTVNVASLTTPGTVTARSITGDHPNIDYSGINPIKSVNRNWSLIGSSINAVYDATFTFDALDKDPSATYSNFIVAKYDGATWTRPTVGAKNPTSTQATGLTSFSEFALGEPRSAPITFTVINTNDAGPGSMRQAMIDAASIPGLDLIHFNIPGPSYTIQPTTPLPTITDPVIIDGTTQPGFSGKPIIELSGMSAGTGAHGLDIQASGCTVRGLVINNFSTGHGIHIGGSGSRGNSIRGNYMGIDASGQLPRPNQRGIQIENSSGNTIGGLFPAGRNVISGGHEIAINIIAGSDSNIVVGNFVGTNFEGTAALPNNNGIWIQNSSHNRVGASMAGARNIVSGNNGNGIWIDLSGTGNSVRGNYVGVAADGDTPLGNKHFGIKISGCAGNMIGGPNPGDGNVVSANGSLSPPRHGIYIEHENSGTGNLVQGNVVGTDATGMLARGNINFGICALNASHVRIINNLVSANRYGVVLWGDDAGAGANNNIVQGNLIGTKANGTERLGNELGLYVRKGHYNIIGGTSSAARNIISGNTHYGLAIGRAQSSNNLVQGNYIGLDINGSTTPLGNGYDHPTSLGFGVDVFDATGNIIGGSDPGAANVISGNIGYGILIDKDAETTTANVVQGNLIGTDPTGMTAVGNTFGITIKDASGNLIGGVNTSNRNIISGNTDDGINILGSSATGNTIAGNYIGIAADGTTALGNGDDGINIESPNNIIGGAIAGAGNIISANQSTGVVIVGSGVADNKVLGNYIGTSASGAVSRGNGEGGIFIGNGASNNIIGGATQFERNVISGNTGRGVMIASPAPLVSAGNRIMGNYIGTSAGGDGAVGNSAEGVFVGSGTTLTTLGIGNVISGNSSLGIRIQQSNGNLVKGNLVGTDASGMNRLANGESGIWVQDSDDNIVGGSESGARNIFSGNAWSGVVLIGDSKRNKVRGNYIGVGADGATPLGGLAGVYMLQSASDNTVGGTNAAERNVISGHNNGVVLRKGAHANRVLGNFIGTDVKGTNSVPNGNGVLIERGASTDPCPFDNIIGPNNTISGNTDCGVLVRDPLSANNSILSNSIYSNGGLGIDLGGDGVTANDVNDTDTGPNSLQNHPSLSSVQFASGSVSISGALNSIANTEFTLQFFSNQLADPTGYGEGQKLLGTETVVTNGSGDASFDVTYSIGTYAGQVITATATDPDGNTSEFSKAIGGTVGQVVAAGDFPMTFQINSLGVPTISGDSELNAIRNAFAAWENIPTSKIDFTDGGLTSARYASATDGINLVTFQDDQFPFAPGVLAVAAKTIDVTEGDANGHIVDADVVFNPAWIDHPKYPIGTDPAKSYFDIQSIATHEIGHVVGLVHSGVVNSTMFFVLQKGTDARTLRTDDIAWASYRYQEANYGTSFGSISGTVTDGYNPGAPVAGALLIASNVTTGDSIHAYSDAAGHYLIPGLPAGDYKVSLQPLDGDVEGYPLKPSNISAYIYAITKNIDYPHEFYSGSDESDTDDPSLSVPVSVAVGTETPQVNLVTNRDNVPPTIVAISPQDGSTGVKVTSDIILKFSEPIIPAALEGAFTLSKMGDPTAVAGKFTYLNKNQNALFTPGSPLAFNTAYTAKITEALTDVHGVALASVFSSSFTTEATDLIAPVLTQIDPPEGEDSVFVTTKITMVFSEPIDPNSLTVSTDFQAGSFSLSSAQGKVDGTLEFNESKTTVMFTPRRSLLENVPYTVALTSGVTDIAGNPIVPFTSTFTTIPESAPQVLTWGPANNATGISVNTSVFVDFSEPMDTASIRAHTTLKSASNVPVETELEFLYENSRVVLRPLLPLSFSTSYTLVLTTDITDASGVHLVTGMTSNFTTGAAPSKPSIATIEPPKAIIGVEVVIAGEGFDPSPANNVVLFNNVSAPVIAASLTAITTKVPQGLLNLTNPLCTVTVTVNGVTSNGYPFEVLPMVADRTNVAVAGVDADEESKDADITPDGGIAYVTNTGADNVSVIDLNTASVIGTVAVGDAPLKIAINPAGTRAYVTNYGSNTLSIIDLVKNSSTYNKVIKDIPVGLNPIGVAVTPDGKRVYVANYTSKDVTVIDTDPKSGTFDQAVGNIDTDAENRDIDVSPDGGLAFVTGTAGLTIINIDPNATDPATGESLYNTAVAGVDTDTETRDVEVTPDGGIAIVTTMSGDILLIDVYPKSPSFGQAVGQVDTEGESRDVDVSPDGMFVYITDYDRNTVSVYEFAYAAGASPMGVTGQRASGNPVVAADISLKLVATIQVGPAPEGIVIDAAGQRAVVANSGDGTATIIDISTAEPVDAVQDLITDVRLLEAQGKLSKGHATSLIAKLNAANKQLLKNKPHVAVNQLGAFINEVKALMSGGVISREIGDALIYAANRVIALLTDPNQKLADANLAKGDEQVEFDLAQNYPNPFNPQTTISFNISERAQEGIHVRLMVYNVVGQLVATLVDEVKMPGRYTARWDGTSSSGAKLPSGIYFCHITAGGFTKVNKMILTK